MIVAVPVATSVLSPSEVSPLPALWVKPPAVIVALFVILVALLMTNDDNAVTSPKFASNVILPAAPGFKVRSIAPLMAA